MQRLDNDMVWWTVLKQAPVIEEQALYHGTWLLAIQKTSQIAHDFSHIIVGNFGAPACSNALRTIDQHHRYDRNVPLRLNSQVVVSQMTQQWLVFSVEHMSRQSTKTAKNVLKHKLSNKQTEISDSTHTLGFV